MPPAWLVASGAAALLAWAGWRLGWLSRGGAVAAAGVGAAVFTAGPAAATLLAVFFVSGSGLTRINDRRGAYTTMPAEHGRTARQVLANGGWAAGGALLTLARPELGWPVILGSLVTAQADTWATEIGAWSSRPPRLMTTGRPVQAGTSGGVTVLGTVGGIGGAVILAAAGGLMGVPHAPAALAGGVAGMLADSFLGATVQGAFHCDTCDSATERRVHHCGHRARRVKGWGWLDNDMVNAGATACGAAATVLLSRWL